VEKGGFLSERIVVVMATFQGERFIAAQLDSLARQSRLPDRLIVADDGSNDGTLALIRAFAAVAPFPVDIVINPVRLNYAQNFIEAAGRADEEIIFFADQDDVWHAEKIARVMAVFEAVDALVVGHDIRLIDDAGVETLPSYFAKLARQDVPARMCLKGCTLAFRRSLIEACGWPAAPLGISHDLWIASLGEATGRRRVLDEVLVSHRIHGGNASAWFLNRDALKRWRGAVRKLMPYRDWATLDLFLETYFGRTPKRAARAVAAALALHPAVAADGALQRFNRAVRVHEWLSFWLRK